MVFRPTIIFTAAVVLATCGLGAADKKPNKATDPQPGWNDAQMLQQPAAESIDLSAYNAIREEGLHHSNVIDYTGGLTDGISPRLTGSPNMAKANAWTRDQLTKMGCVNAHLEDWGEFGMGWQQLNTWVRMTQPDTGVFVAQATPWSPSTNGPVTAQAISAVIEDEKDIAKYKGKLSGKIVLLGAMRAVPVPDKPFFERYTDKDLKELESLPLSGRDPDMETRIERYGKHNKLTNLVIQFLD